MTRTSPFFPSFGDLPPTLPVFPLSEVLLLPRGMLPLNIFEPRYIAMVDDALSTNRLIGMIQPVPEDRAAEVPGLHRVGCAGRVTSFDETEDGRYLITLSGVCRFRTGPEMPTTRGYRRLATDWESFRADMDGEGEASLDRDRLNTALKLYFRKTGIDANWDAIENTPDERLVTTLSMICPFNGLEKQALLEAATAGERAETLLSLIEMATLAGTGNNDDEGGAARH